MPSKVNAKNKSNNLTCWVETGSYVHYVVCWTQVDPGWDWGWYCGWRWGWGLRRLNWYWGLHWLAHRPGWRFGPSPTADAPPGPADAPTGVASEAVGAGRQRGLSWAARLLNAAPPTTGTAALEDQGGEDKALMSEMITTTRSKELVSSVWATSLHHLYSHH